MSSGEVQGVLVSHGKMAEGLLDAVREITGLTEGLITLDNLGLTPDALEERLEYLTKGRPSVVFVDLPAAVARSWRAASERGRRISPSCVASICRSSLTSSSTGCCRWRIS